jgi:uncharacterized membrane protein YGL010W
MALLKLNEEWSRLMELYHADHQHPVNQACHKIGIPMIVASLPLGVSIVGLPVAVPLFVVGWTFQFVGHAFEGKKPSFTNDRRQLVVGVLWWAKKMGLGLVETTTPTTPPDIDVPRAA